MTTATPSGVGIGLRWELAEDLFRELPERVRWLEIHPENYIGRAGFFEAHLEQARATHPIVTHGLTLCLGSPEPFEPAYVARLKALVRTLGSRWHSEHLCWGGVDGAFLHDLLPLPQTTASAKMAAARIRELRDAIEVDVALENVSTYGHPGPRQLDEIDFVLDVLDRSGAKMLLDVNNVWVNANNHGIDPKTYIDRIPKDRVVQIHVAGHFVRPDGLIIDTHAEPVRDEVKDLLAHALTRLGGVPVLLERDGNYPPFGELMAEVASLSEIYDRSTGASR
jgi:uncharacterized protein (UPF0276 family)